VKVGKKTPLTLAHFGFGRTAFACSTMPPCPPRWWRYATPARYSWTVDFAARRAKAREEMQPLLDGAAKIKAEVVDLKRLKRLKKNKAGTNALAALEAQIREKDKAARDLESQAAAIDASVFDLKAVNPTR
jgi:type I restriction enzyme M protein